LNNKYLPLLLILILATFLSFFNYRGIDFSDEYNYARNAWMISNGTFELSPSVFKNRFGLLIPMAGFVKLLGVEPFVFPIWSFIGFVILLISNFYFTRIVDPNIAIISTLFLALNPLLLELSADVSQDIIMTAFATISVFMLWRIQDMPNHFSYRWGILFSFILFFAFATKIGVFYIGPFFLFLFIKDFLRRRNTKFWIGAILSGGLLLFIYFYIYYHFTGNPFYRINAIEGEFNVHYESYGSRPTWEFWTRMTIFPIPFLLKSYGLGVFSMLTGLWVFMFFNTKSDSPKISSKAVSFNCFKRKIYFELSYFPNFLLLYFLFLLFIHLFGTTSLKYYNPLILSERMWLLLVPPASLLSVFVLEKVLPYIKGYNKNIVLIYFGMIIGLCALGLYLTKDQYPWFILPLTVSMLLLIWLKYKSYAFFKNKKYIPHLLVLLPFLILQLSVISNYKENTPFFFQKDFLESLKPNETHLIYTDRSLPDMYDIYYEFLPPENIEYRRWETADSSDISSFDHFYVIYDQKKTIWLAEFVGLKVPDFVKDKSIGRYILQNEYLEIKELNIDDLKRIKRVEE
jgi:4-amino-4-deoxy-L-arabinose transferase-like glycosyltransferase